MRSEKTLRPEKGNPLALAAFTVPASALIAVRYYPLLTGLSTLLFILFFNRKDTPGCTA